MNDEYISEVDLAVVFHFFARGSHILHDGCGVSALVELHDHLLGHEVHGDFFHTRGTPGGFFHLVGAVRAVYFDFIGLLHDDRLFSVLRLNNNLIV